MEDQIYLSHHGILGQRWGIRRYQNKDGTLTAAGKKRAAKLEEEYSRITKKKLSEETQKKADAKKPISQMTNEELKEKTNRMTLEKNFIDAQQKLSALTPQQTAKGNAALDKMKAYVVSEVPKRLIDVGEKALKQKLGLDGVDRELNAWKRASELARYKNQTDKNKKEMEDRNNSIKREIENAQRAESYYEQMKKAGTAKDDWDEYVAEKKKKQAEQEAARRAEKERENEEKIKRLPANVTYRRRF